jgi:hypothetical protein
MGFGVNLPLVHRLTTELVQYASTFARNSYTVAWGKAQVPRQELQTYILPNMSSCTVFSSNLDETFGC